MLRAHAFEFFFGFHLLHICQLKIGTVWAAISFIPVQYVCLDWFQCVCVYISVLLGLVCVLYHAGQPLSEATVCFLELQAGAVVHHCLSWSR